jgi:hypothetical protein
MIGFYSYYAVPTNFRALNSFSWEKEAKAAMATTPARVAPAMSAPPATILIAALAATCSIAAPDDA